jgi:hypothetical protein
VKTSDRLSVGELYSRQQLREMFGIADQTINTGIFRPAGHESVWLFVTREKDPGMTEYEDRLEGDVLHWQGQLAGLKDSLIAEHQQRGLELLVFYRDAKRQYEDYAFKYEGPFTYESHAGANPASFRLVRDAAALAHAQAAAEPAADVPDAADRGGAREGGELGRGPCLVDVLGALQQSSKESVVADGRLTELQQRMHVPDAIEDWVADRIAAWSDDQDHRPLLIVLSGNAGDGKSELIERLRGRPGVADANVRVIADATHAESPSQSQAARLVEALDPFADTPESSHDSALCVLVAINVGMVIAFFSALEESREASRFAELRGVLFSRLGLSRTSPPQPASWSCEVINLDHRNILGGDGEGLFDGMLERLDPERPQSITSDAAAACADCPVRASCWVRTNLNLMRMPFVRAQLRDLLWKVSLADDIHLSPRNGWDFLYHAITGGPRVSEAEYLSCDWLRQNLPHQPGDVTPEQLALIHRRLLYHGIFEPPHQTSSPANSILGGLARADPIRRSGRQTHVAEGKVRADPRVDGQMLGQLAAEASEPATDGRRPDPLLETLAALTDSLELWRAPDGDGNGTDLAYGVSRRARLTGMPAAVHEEVTDSTAQDFRQLLDAYARWLPGEGAPREVEAFWTDVLIAGVQAMFGLPLDGQTYFRLDTLSPVTRYPAYVPIDLRQSVRLVEDPALDGRASGLDALRYTPRAVHAAIRSGRDEAWPVPIDLQLFRLLRQVIRGYAASSVDLEAFFRLRYACERLGAAGDETEMVFRSLTTARAYRMRREERLTGSTTTFSEIA